MDNKKDNNNHLLSLEIEKGNKELVNIMGRKKSRNDLFIKQLRANGILDTSKAWRTINAQIKKELNHGVLTSDNVPTRIDKLIIKMSEREEFVSLNEVENHKSNMLKNKMISKGNCLVSLPYLKREEYGYDEVIEDIDILNNSNKKDIIWKNDSILFFDGGFSIKTSGKTILFNEIDNITLTNEGFFNSIVYINFDNEDKLIFRAVKETIIAIKSIIDEKPDMSHLI